MILTIILLLIPIISIFAFLFDADTLFYITGIMSFIGCIGQLLSGKIRPKSIILWGIICWIITNWTTTINAVLLGTCAFIELNNIFFIILMIFGRLGSRKQQNQNLKPNTHSSTQFLSHDDNFRMIIQSYFLKKYNSATIEVNNDSLPDEELRALIENACFEIKNDKITKHFFAELPDFDNFITVDTPVKTNFNAAQILEEEKWKFLEIRYKSYFNKSLAQTKLINLQVNR